MSLRIAQALRLQPAPRLALVGAGGKTRTLFCLGRELRQAHPAVWLCATTHLAADQTRWADQHIILADDTLADDATWQAGRGLVLFTGPVGADERTAGLSETWMARIKAQADLGARPLLIEADGSRRMPLKAPAQHEPVIPAWVDLVLVVAGLSGVGQKLDEEHVHRPERFAVLSGLVGGEEITPEALAVLLRHPQGGLKNIPPRARRVALLAQADSSARQAIGRRMAELLTGTYQSVLVADLPALDAPAGPQQPIVALHEPVAGVVLAAGASQRMGRTKQILEWQGRPLVRHAAETALAAGLSPVVVVIGHSSDDVRAALERLPVRIVHNPNWQDGQSSSVAAGVQALPAGVGAAIFLLADQPHTPAALVHSLVELHAATLAPLVAPMVDGQRANPVLFDRVTFEDLLAVQGDQGGRALFSRYPVTWLPWHDASAALDVDTPDDYRRLLEDLP